MPPYQPLGEYALEHACKQVGFDSHVDQARDGRKGRIGMKCREDKVSSERGLHRDRGSLCIPNFADQDDVGILPQQRAQNLGKGESQFLIDLNLRDPLYAVLDRILDSNDVEARANKALQDCV
jgi:hypothetical protein